MGVSVPGEATTEGQPAPPIRSFVDAVRSAFAPVTGVLRSIEVDTRMLGMVAALIIIWVSFGLVSGGTFLTARNLWNLSVQSASIAIMATGMVLVIVSRNIDLSVGSMLGFLGYTMAMFQAVWIPQSLGLGLEQPFTWVVTLVLGIALGAAVGGIQGFVVAYGGVPSFIVTLGGLLIWRGLIFRYAQGQTIAPLDTTFQMLGGGTVGTRVGALGEWPSWILGVVICLVIAYTLIASRRRRRRYGFPVRPMWAEVLVGAVACGVVLGTVWVANSYPLPPSAAVQTARLDAAVTSLGVQNELDVISAAVIGGTSFAGGIGTVPGAILGAVVMQSLRSGMVLLLVDSPTQDIVVGIVLVVAVGLDTVVRRRVS